MNGRLDQNIAKKLLPALEDSQGFDGIYTRDGRAWPLRAIPTEPDWDRDDDRSATTEEWVEIKFLVSPLAWTRAGFGLPEQGDRYTVTLADGVQRTYALLGRKGTRPYEMAANGTHYGLRMKWVKG